jgi:alkylated DNA repair dioxygenase AlkB
MGQLAAQASLFGFGEPGLDLEFRATRRIPLSAGAWIEHVPGWLHGHEVLFEALRDTTAWQHQRRRMYERVVDVPRLVASVPDDGPGHPVLARASLALSERYGLALGEISLAYYRDGQDSVAWHGDRLGRLVDDTVVAILSVGSPRRFLLRPAAGGPSRAYELGWGDLLVMGGSCQRTWQHTVPKVASAGPRISIQFRPSVDDDAA